MVPKQEIQIVRFQAGQQLHKTAFQKLHFNLRIPFRKKLQNLRNHAGSPDPLDAHFDEDHAGGVPVLLERMDVDAIVIPDVPDDGRDAVEAAAAEAGTPVYPLSSDAQGSLGLASIQFYSPQSFSDSNDSGLSLLVCLPGLSTLVTGDMSADGESLLLATHQLSAVDILVAGHHGSKYSTSRVLLDTVCPKAVVISVGQNSYGHPSPETLERIAASGEYLEIFHCSISTVCICDAASSVTV